MKTIGYVFLCALLLAAGAGLAIDSAGQKGKTVMPLANKTTDKTPPSLSEAEIQEWRSKPDSYWRSQLNEQEYKVCRGGGTERAFTGAYHDTKTPGIYHCRCCNLPLFRSQQKFDSGTGWPSFWDAIIPENVELHEDRSFFMRRVEVRCKRCNAHLGHVFDDGPQPTGKRYCINSVCLKHVPEESQP